MKKVILLFTCTVFLDFTSAMLRPEQNLPEDFLLYPPTYFFIQKKDGDVYFGYLNCNGRKVPEWIQAEEYHQDDAVEHAYVRMRNGITFISIVKRLEHGININDQLPEELRCFILYDQIHILVADLRPVNQVQRPIISGLHIEVRMPDEHNHRYRGRFEYYHGPRPSWLRAY